MLVKSQYTIAEEYGKAPARGMVAVLVAVLTGDARVCRRAWGSVTVGFASTAAAAKEQFVAYNFRPCS